MLRHLHPVVLFALVGLVFASEKPAGRLEARQIDIPIVGDIIDILTSDITPQTTTAADVPTTVPTSVIVPTTSVAPITTTTTRPATTTSRVPSTSSPSAVPQTTTTTTSRLPSTTLAPTSSTEVQPDTTSSVAIAPTTSDAEPTETSVRVPETMTTVTSFVDDLSTTGTRSTSATTSSTSKPGLASGYNTETNTLSAESKKLIGGIVGGICGALLLAGVGFVVYKMWGRKRHDRAGGEEDYFVAGGSGGSMSPDSRDSLGKEQGDGWGPSSLTSKDSEPLDRYKSPGHVAVSPVANSWGGRSPNAASNF